MAKETKKGRRTAKKGEEGYYERSTQAAHEAAQEAHTIFLTAEEFTEAANRYFDECDEEGLIYGEAGLALALGRYNAKGKPVTLATLRRWYDGDSCKHLQEAVQVAYLRIQSQIETDPRYHDKNMATRGIFVLKQPRFGGYQDKQEVKNDSTVRVIFGNGVDASDFK